MKISPPVRVLVIALAGLVLAGLSGAGFVYFYLVPRLPSIENLKDVRFQVPLRVFTRDNKLMAEFGEKKRVPLKLDEVPDLLVKAVLAAEDDRFFSHPGVDYQGLLRAAGVIMLTGEKSQGGSTITMQVARNFFLSNEKTFLRKLNEILLSFKIEHALTKQEILELYLNKIYLGNRAYGVGAAAQIYYGTDVQSLTTAQFAMIAGMPKAPSRYNPIVNPQRALLRRDYVLRRMHELGFITDEVFKTAIEEPDMARLHGLTLEAEAPHLAEMVRAEVIQRVGDEEAVYTLGYKVYTTVDAKLQNAANAALRRALIEYDRRHGYRGAEGHVTLPANADKTAWREALAGRAPSGGLLPALVAAVEGQTATIYNPDLGGTATLPWEGLSWARRYQNAYAMGPKPKSAGEILKVGDIVRIERPMGEAAWSLAQIPAIEGALVSVAPHDGAILALAGGFDFYNSKYNRVTQSQRQPGSSFKPFIYAAALDHGYTPATLINDAPLVFEGDAGDADWRPENFSGEFLGPTRMREALTHSRNLVSIRILQDIGIEYALSYAGRFGFTTQQMPRNFSLALGSGAASPLEMATGYAALANTGYKVSPYFITRIEDADGKVIYRAVPEVACDGCAKSGERPANRIISAQTAYQMTSMLRDVAIRGTAARARVLGRNDLAGKTGTTNDQQDAWFSGYNGDVVATAWVGFDQPQPLGGSETGSQAALPMWIYFMEQALKGMPERLPPLPADMVTVRIDPATGLLAGSDDPKAIFETFRADQVPQQTATSPGQTPEESAGQLY